MQEISVKVTKLADRKYWLMYYDDPLTGRRVTRSTKQMAKREAERAAAKWEAELCEGRYKRPSNTDWATFRERYEQEVLPSFAKSTGRMVSTVFNSLERIINPQRLRDITAERLSYFQSKLREDGRAEPTIRTYLAHLKAALKWAVELGLLPEAPKVKMPIRAKGSKLMKGRPITGEDFQRLLDSVEAGLAVIGKRVQRRPAKRKQSATAVAKRIEQSDSSIAQAAPSWRYLLEGLWLSGLRLGEALNLSWDEPDKLHVVLDGRRPMFRIHAELEKGNEDRLLPMTPDFAQFLLATPKGKRTGPIFRPLRTKGKGECRHEDYAGKVISAIGKVARVVVNKTPGGKIKNASAHDLRRSFGARWAPRVMPAVLQQLMRHESIETTMRYYVGQNSEANADAVWEAFERVNTFVNTRPISPPAQKESLS